MQVHNVRYVITKREKYYVCDECNTAYPTKLMVTVDHGKIKIVIVEINLRDSKINGS